MTTSLQVKDKGVHIVSAGGTYIYNKIPDGAIKKKLTDSAIYVKENAPAYAGAAIDIGTKTVNYVGKKGYEVGKGIYDKASENEKVKAIGGTVYNQAKVVTGAVGSYIASKTGYGAEGNAKPEGAEEAKETDPAIPASSEEQPLLPNPDMTKLPAEEKKE